MSETILQVENEWVHAVSGVVADEGMGRIRVNGMNFELDYKDFSKKTTSESLVLLKPWSFVQNYIDLFSRTEHAHVLELGMWQGGGAVLFAALFKRLRRLASVDKREPVTAMYEQVLPRQDLLDKLSLYYRTSQDDPVMLRQIVADDMDGRLDVVMDDCSHEYDLTRASFHLLFPLLRPGGLYIIEDWGWAHWPNYQKPGDYFWEKPALSNLIFELVALQASHSGWIRRITLLSGAMAVIEKGVSPLPEPFILSDSILMRGKKMTLI